MSQGGKDNLCDAGPCRDHDLLTAMEHQFEGEEALPTRFDDRVEDGQALTCPCALVVDHAHQIGGHVEFFDGRGQCEASVLKLPVHFDGRSHRHTGFEDDLLLDADVEARFAKAIAGAMDLQLVGGHPPDRGFCQ